MLSNLLGKFALWKLFSLSSYSNLETDEQWLLLRLWWLEILLPFFLMQLLSVSLTDLISVRKHLLVLKVRFLIEVSSVLTF